METLSSSSTSPLHSSSYTHSADISASDSSRYFSGRHFASTTPLPSGHDLLLFDDALKPPAAAEVELMKERFAKLLLGEDMSGSGKGVCTALAVSNAITNLSATVFGELWRLEPLAAPKMAMWAREMEWLLSITDSIVELTPSRQDFPGGGAYEVMVARPRSDLYMNLPALKKLDAMLVGMLDGFRGTEFCYVDRGVLVGDSEDEFPSPSVGRPSSLRQEEKWWLPCPRLPVNGLSEEGRKRLQQCRDCAGQILKAAMAINSGVLAEMEVPDVYIDALPKSGKCCLGEVIYRYITADQFSPECLLDCLDVSSEHQALEIANRVEAAVHVWKLKDCKRHPLHLKPKKSSWGGRVMGFVSDAERSHFLAQRAEGLLQSLRLRYTGLPQTDLDMTKIQYNKDVGQAILESYSRVLESLAFNIMARIDDLIYVDDATKKCVAAEAASLFNRGFGGLPAQKMISPSLFSMENMPYASPFTTPSYYSPARVTASPGRAQPSPSKGGHQELHDWKSGKGVAADTEKPWSYAGTLSARKDGDVRERD